MTMFLSTLFSMLPLPALLMEFGPVRREGMLSAIYGPYVKRAYAQLEHEEESFIRPSWLGNEVSDDHRYFNGALSRHPFSEWYNQ